MRGHDGGGTGPDAAIRLGTEEADCVTSFNSYERYFSRYGRFAGDSLAPIGDSASVDAQHLRGGLVKGSAGRAFVHLWPGSQRFRANLGKGVRERRDIDAVRIGDEQRTERVEGVSRVVQGFGAAMKQRKNTGRRVPPSA